MLLFINNWKIDYLFVIINCKSMLVVLQNIQVCHSNMQSSKFIFALLNRIESIRQTLTLSIMPLAIMHIPH